MQLFLCLVCTLLGACLHAVGALKPLPLNKQSRQPHVSLKVDLNSIKDTEKSFIVEVVAKRSAVKSRERAASSTYTTTYKETNEDLIAKAQESPLGKVFGIAMNPTTLLLALYVSGLGWSNVLKILKKPLQKKETKTAAAAAAEALPFQIFECEVWWSRNDSELSIVAVI